MTDDGIREALRLDFEQTADWRRSKAADYPEDSRNLEAAELLDKLAASVETVAPDLLDAYGSLRDDYMDSEQHSEMFRQIGSARGPKQPRTLLRRASPTEQWERKVRERRVATKRWAARGLDPGPSASARGDEPMHCGQCRQGPRISAFMLPISNFGNRYLIPVPSGTFGLSPNGVKKPSSAKASPNSINMLSDISRPNAFSRRASSISASITTNAPP